MRRLAGLSLVLVSLWLSACGVDGTTDEGEVNKLQVSQQTLRLSQLGGQYLIEAVLLDDDGQPLVEQPVITFSSSDETVVTVDAGGVVTAIAEGEAVITVATEGWQQLIDVLVDTSLYDLVGQVRFEDRLYDSGGFTGATAFKPVRNVVIDLLDTSDQVVQSAHTDDEGRYIFPGVSFANYRVAVRAQTDVTRAALIEVADLAGAIYAVSASVDVAAANNALDIPLSSAAGPFNILEVMQNGIEFATSFGATGLPPVRAFWQPGNYRGTYYCAGYDSSWCPRGPGMYIYSEGDGGDTDEFDDDVLWHEFSHLLADTLSRDDSPGGCHYLGWNDLDMRLAWSEGWGDFFPAAVKAWLAADPLLSSRLSLGDGVAPSVYVDTSGGGTIVSVDIAQASSHLYASNELSVAKVLWEVQKQFGMAPLWTVLGNYMPSITTPTNLEAFWDGWLATRSVTAEELGAMRTIFNARQIFYQPDVHEADENADAGRKLAVNSAETHYLYRDDGVADKDVVAFDVVAGNTYTVQTLGLRNGTDTWLRVRDAAGNTLSVGGQALENDDQYDSSAYFFTDSGPASCGEPRAHNNTTALSSALTFTAPASGTFYVEVSSSPDSVPYPQAGRYGTYSLRISTP